MAVRRLTGTKPSRKRPRRTRFSRTGRKPSSSSVFRQHQGYRAGGSVFSTHGLTSISRYKAAGIKPWKASKAAAFKSAGKKNPYPVKTKAAAYKAAGKKAPASWTKPATKPAKYKAAKVKRVA